MPRLSHTQMKRLTALTRVHGSENIGQLSSDVKEKLVSEGYADANGHGHLKLSNKGVNEIERLSNIMGLINKEAEEQDKIK
tara:strand:+ start:684 stop:926 length:243 start_codon:yes stop_codon:yes gene_type:complete